MLRLAETKKILHGLLKLFRITVPVSLISSNHEPHYVHNEDYKQLKVQFPQLPKEWEGRYVAGQMYQQQESLPKQLVPPLMQSLKKYINAVQNLVTEEELKKTKNIVAEFGMPKGIGEQLQKELVERAEREENWILDWFRVEEFLAHRTSTVTNSIPGFTFYFKPLRDREEYIRKAANYLIATMKCSMLIEHNAFPPETYRRRPLCMEQYNNIFSICRIPEEPVDAIRSTSFTESRHVIIARNGHLFKLDVLYECPDGTLALPPPDHIIKQLHGILDASPEHCEHPVGVLTSEQRDNWYHTRQKLMLDPINRGSLDTVETAQVILSLDELPTETNANIDHTSLEYQTEMIARGFHGGGSKQYSCNRWFDLTRQLMIGGSGWLGAFYEHSVNDGAIFFRSGLFVHNLMKVHDNLTDSSPVPTSALKSFQHLDWNISPEVANDIEKAKKLIDVLVEDTDIYTSVFKDFGTSFFKSLQLSFDSFIQNAMILAYHRLYNKIMHPVYEAGTLRLFKLGRFTRMRNDTSEAYAFINIMNDPNSFDVEKTNALYAAMDAFSKVTVESTQGQDFDNHLTGLEVIARKKGLELEIFKDPSFKKVFNFGIISSQVTMRSQLEGPEENPHLVINGTYIPEGYSICYSPEDNYVAITITSFRSSPVSDSKLFMNKFVDAMREMKELISK